MREKITNSKFLIVYVLLFGGFSSWAQAPTAVCQDFTAQLDATGSVTILASDIDNGSSDPDGDPITLSLDQDTFDCDTLNGPAPMLAYQMSDDMQSGNQGYNGTLGEFFTVNEDVTVDRLGVFDHLGDGILNGAIQVGIFDVATQQLLAGLSTSISGSSDPLVNGHRMRSITPVVLTPGDYIVAAQGFDGIDQNGNPVLGNPPSNLKNDGNGVLTFGTSRFGPGNNTFQYPTNVQNNANAYAAPTFSFIGESNMVNVTLTVTDDNGNSDTCTATVTVEDNIAPTITCVADATRDADAGTCEYIVVGTEFDATFTDNCSSATITNDYNNEATLDGELLEAGDTTVVWTVDDGNGQTDTCTTIITVVDNDAPEFICVAPFEVILDENGEASINAIQVVGETLTITNVSGDNGSFNSGTTDFTASVNTDVTVSFDWDYSTNDPGFESFGYLIDGVYTELASGNASGTGEVALVAGQIFGFRTFTVDNIFGRGTATITNFLPGYFGQFAQDNWTLTLNNSDGTASFSGMPGVTDSCGVESISLDISEFTCADVGDNIVTFTATDVNGNSASCTTTVTVVDNTPAVVASGPVDIFTGTGSNSDGCETIVNYDPVTEASFTFEADNCFDSAMITVAQTGGLGSGSSFPVGTTVEEYTITDANGLEIIYTFEVNISDTTLPTISCPDEVVVAGDDAGNYTIEDYTDLVTDNCSSGADLLVVQEPAAGTVVTDPSTTEITITATDEAGNEQLCTFNLVVDETLSIEDAASLNNSLTLYPNPASSSINLKTNGGVIDNVSVYDLRGRLVMEVPSQDAVITLNVERLQTGAYLVVVQSNDAIATKRFIKE